MKGGHKICKAEEDTTFDWYSKYIDEYCLHYHYSFCLWKLYFSICNKNLDDHKESRKWIETVVDDIESEFKDLKQNRDWWRALAFVSITTAIMIFGILMSYI